MFLALLVIASAVALSPAQRDGRRAEASKTNSPGYSDNRRQFVSEQELPLYEDDSAVNYQPTVAVRAPHQRSTGAYNNQEQRYRSRGPTQNTQSKVQYIPAAPSFRLKGESSQQLEKLPIEESINADHILEAEGSSFISDVEEDEYQDENNYGDAYEEQPAVESEERIGVVGVGGIGGGPIVVTGGVGGGYVGGVGGGVGSGVVGGGVGGGVGVGGGQSFGHSYGKKEGHGYQHGDHHAKGHKHSKGHKANESYDKGHVEKHGHEHKKGGKKESVGVKNGHIDEHKAYLKGDTHKKEAKGADKFHSKGHKKGKKTSGFRNVHHKDEFKKDEVYYDDEHDIGHEKIKAHEEGGRHESKGGASKKGHLNSGYVDAVKGLEGQKEEAHKYASSKGHAGHVGHKAEEGLGEGFHKAEGHKGEEGHGHFYKKAGGGASLG